MSKKEKATREYLQTLTKDRVIELCLQYINDKNIAEQQLEALMLEISKQEVEQHDLPDYCTRTGTDCTNLGKIEELQQQIEEKDKDIEKLHRDKEWYSMWHKEFQKRIEDLTTELETYRPTKLHGNGQCECYKCKQEGKQPIHWTNWCNEYKGHIYCNDCLKEILKEEQSSQTQLAIKELEKVKVNLKDRISMMKNEEHSYLQKVVAWRDICDQINKQIKELKGENK